MRYQAAITSNFDMWGTSPKEVIRQLMRTPAREIKREALGLLSLGAIVDIAAVRMQSGKFGSADGLGVPYYRQDRPTRDVTIDSGLLGAGPAGTGASCL